MANVAINEARPAASTEGAWAGLTPAGAAWMGLCQETAFAWLQASAVIFNAMTEMGSAQAKALRETVVQAGMRPPAPLWLAGPGTALRDQFLLVGEQAERTARCV